VSIATTHCATGLSLKIADLVSLFISGGCRSMSQLLTGTVWHEATVKSGAQVSITHIADRFICLFPVPQELNGTL